MRIEVDTSALLGVLTADPDFGPSSREALRRAYDAGALIACDIVWSEVRAHFPEEADFRATLATLGVVYEPLRQEAAELAGALWREYCLAVRRRDRDRIVADFLIGAHAQFSGRRPSHAGSRLLRQPVQGAAPYRSDPSVGCLMARRRSGAPIFVRRPARVCHP